MNGDNVTTERSNEEIRANIKFLRKQRFFLIIKAIFKTIFQLLFGVVKLICKLVTGFRI